MKNAANFLFTFPCRWMRVHKMCQHREEDEIILTISSSPPDKRDTLSYY